MQVAIKSLVDIEVDFDGSSNEDGNVWLSGTVTIAAGTNEITVPVGCWLDTDDDHQIWNSSHEGARIIGAVVSGKNVEANGECIPSEFIAESALEIGDIVCSLLREKYTDACIS